MCIRDRLIAGVGGTIPHMADLNQLAARLVKDATEGKPAESCLLYTSRCV